MGTYKNKKVLIFGLGLLGGGVAAANWFIKRGTKVTIADLKTKKELASSLKMIRSKVKFSLGRHKLADIRNNDVIVVNPSISIHEPFVQKAITMGKEVVNEATLFYKNFEGKIIGITGTRGKTTTTHWTAHLLAGKDKPLLAGNSPDHPFLASTLHATRYTTAVTELSSFHLEFFDRFARKPDIAVITNIYQDHFNRYKDYPDYVAAKASIFTDQNATQHLILNYDNRWTAHLRKLPHASKEWFFSLQPLPEDFDGLFWSQGKLIFQERGKKRTALDLKGFITKWGKHNVENLMAAVLSAHCAGIAWENMQARISTLPQVPFRQETIYHDKKLTIINDTTATSPEGTIAAVKRFGSPTTILITGGTDRELDFTNWAKIIPNYIVPEHIVLLEGTATKKMLKALKRPLPVYPTLKVCLEAALVFNPRIILFSPGSKSFEKFTNEYDRGEQFNKLVKDAIKKL